ncbi:hypothetical protein BDD12DRAFT_810680 [Trichophaea hybrida]|nr:hypothetical protein BDD12DRAFT_810680 [Trichophaea hybrida]
MCKREARSLTGRYSLLGTCGPRSGLQLSSPAHSTCSIDILVCDIEIMQADHRPKPQLPAERDLCDVHHSTPSSRAPGDQLRNHATTVSKKSLKPAPQKPRVITNVLFTVSVDADLEGTPEISIGAGILGLPSAALAGSGSQA